MSSKLSKMSNSRSPGDSSKEIIQLISSKKQQRNGSKIKYFFMMIFVSWTLQYLHISIVVNIYIWESPTNYMSWTDDPTRFMLKWKSSCFQLIPLVKRAITMMMSKMVVVMRMTMTKKIFKVSTFPICQAGLTIPCVCHNFSNFETPISMWIGLHVKSVKLKIEIKKL